MLLGARSMKILKWQCPQACSHMWGWGSCLHGPHSTHWAAAHPPRAPDHGEEGTVLQDQQRTVSPHRTLGFKKLPCLGCVPAPSLSPSAAEPSVIGDLLSPADREAGILNYAKAQATGASPGAGPGDLGEAGYGARGTRPSFAVTWQKLPSLCAGRHEENGVT